MTRLQALACGVIALSVFGATFATTASFAQAQPNQPQSAPPAGTSPAATPAATPAPATVMTFRSGATWRVVRDRWTDADERAYGDFIARIGDSGCSNVNRCMWDKANPFASSNPPGTHFYADCADLPYFLRGYFAWKQGLPFTYISAVSPKGSTNDIRYTFSGNRIRSRRTVMSGESGQGLLAMLRGNLSSAMYRLHPKDEDTDLYPVRISPKSLRPGTVLYDPNGHLAVVYKVEKDGRVRFIDAHPDNSLTRGTYGKKFVRARPGMGAGFKNWRPFVMAAATKTGSGELVGGTPLFTPNKELPDFSLEQYYGNSGTEPSDGNWSSGQFRVQDLTVDYYDFVRIQMAGGSLNYEPIAEQRNMMKSLCEDIRYRAEAVEISINAGIQNKSQPGRLPRNIYGTDGEWEEYSTPSRDARLKTSFKELRDQMQFLVEEHRRGNKRVVYQGANLTQDLITAYDQEAAACTISYKKSDGTPVTLGYEDIRKRLFKISFDPYHCVERRWGAMDAGELASCRDGAEKTAWYEAEQNLRNQIDRTYEARMDHDLASLRSPGGEGKGVSVAPDVDLRGYLMRELANPTPALPAVPQGQGALAPSARKAPAIASQKSAKPVTSATAPATMPEAPVKPAAVGAPARNNMPGHSGLGVAPTGAAGDANSLTGAEADPKAEKKK